MNYNNSFKTNYNKITKILESEGVNPRIEPQSLEDDSSCILKWNIDTDEHFIYQEDIAINNKDIAWFQSSENDKHLLRVISKENKFEWIPKTYNPVFGCLCLLIEWYENHLIFIYQEKHGIYVCSIRDTKVNDFYIHGGELERKGNRLAYETYQNKLENHVRLIELPSLKELSPISKEEAKKLGLTPQSTNRPNGFLKA
ncbi:hypothetical protein [Aquimarina sediminis]|uniref:hypothetical protein n=1 Tax=Aquimarina sediminis TaxID=2070536 RepID=UPI000CA03F6D|nr:hypothetical protein [Aquimarina sediminis]